MSPYDLIVEPEQVAGATVDQKPVIVHLSSESSYRQGHLPGAVYLPPQALLNGQRPAPGKLPDLEQLQQVFAYLGHTPTTHYLVYDDEGGGWAGRFIWTLDVLGHPHYSYLNGGLLAWKAAGLPLETEFNYPQPSNPKLEIHRAPIAEIDDILPRLDDTSFAVWDARSAPEYHGEQALARKSGHIPNAIHCEWTELMDPSRSFRIRTDAANYLRDKGLTADKEIVTHCQSHHRSGFTYLVGRSLGFNIRGYHGSWAEWGNDPRTPVESGER